MILTIIIILASTFVALNGLLYQPKKNPDGPIAWGNVSSTGKILFAVILLLSFLSVAQSIYDNVSKNKELEAREARIDELILSQAELKLINAHLIKVMSVADGYNALLTGVIVFRQPTTETKIRAALQNLFLKYAEIEITTQNQLGTYKGRIDYGAHPEVRRFLRLPLTASSEYFGRYRSFATPTAYFFEMRCSRLKILNHDKIQYARMNSDERLHATVRGFEWARDFQRLYNIDEILVDKLVIEELDTLFLNQRITWY